MLKSNDTSSTKLKFIPPKEERQFPRYASYAASIMKTHDGIGFAKNSLNNRMWTYKSTDEVIGKNYDQTPRYKRVRVTSHAFLLEAIDGEYFTLYEIKPGLTTDELPWMRKFYYDGWRWMPVTDYVLNSKYYAEKIESGVYQTMMRPVPITTNEYVEWRLAVERERLGIPQ